MSCRDVVQDVEPWAPPPRACPDAAWWAATTMTTVGYGDRFPVAGTGRLIVVTLLVAGIAVLGTVTATLASSVVERVQDADERAELATQRDCRR